MNVRKKTSEQLLGDAAIFRQFAEASPEGFGISDFDGCIVYVNPTLCRLFGEEKPEDVIGQNVSRYYPEEYVERRKNEMIPALLREGHWQSEPSILSRQGRMISTRQSTFLIRDELGNPVHIAVVVIDITNRKQVEEALAHFSAIVNSSQDAITGGTTDGIITVWNASAERLYGYTAAEAIGQSVLMFVPPDRREEMASSLAKIKRGEGIESFDTVRRRKDGSLVDVSLALSPIRDASGQTVGISAIVRDITERKRAEEAVTQAKREWERTFNSMPDLIAILDADHRIVRVNQRMAERLGLTPEQCIGRSCFEGVHGTDRPPDFCPHSLTLSDGKPHTVEVHEERLGETSWSPQLRCWTSRAKYSAPCTWPATSPNGRRHVKHWKKSIAP